jgi:hypothetical protein
MATIIAAGALDELRADIRSWQSATGPTRARYRRYVRHDIDALRRAEARRNKLHAAWMRDALHADIAAAEARFVPATKAA